MKTILICNSDEMAIPAALQLKAKDLLLAIIIPEKHREQLIPSFIQMGFETNSIHTVTKAGLESELTILFHQYNPATVFVLTFPWKLPESVISIPIHGCINLHPGLLPKYKGADPIFWQLKNRETKGGITAHLMTNKIDDGPVLMVQEMPLIPGETYGIHVQRIAMLASEMVLKVLDAAKNKQSIKQPETIGTNYFKKPTKQQLTIDWNRQTAAEIDALINAGNPKYNGAFTSIRNIEAAILEVSPADINNIPENTKPGTVVYADGLYGLVVACINKEFLKINTMCMREGYLSGSKLFNMGFCKGELFN